MGLPQIFVSTTYKNVSVKGPFMRTDVNQIDQEYASYTILLNMIDIARTFPLCL